MSLLAASLTASLILGVLLAQPAISAGQAEREQGEREQAEREIVCTGALPFSKEQVQEALLARWHLLGDVTVVRVRGEGRRTFVQVDSGTGAGAGAVAIEREVNLEGRGGEEAARLVAVMALDLAQAGTPFPVPQPPAASVSASAGPRRAASTERQRPFRAGLLLLGPFDQSGPVAHLEPTLDAGWEVVPGFGAFMSAGYRQANSTDVNRSLVLRELPVRAGVTLRRRWLELRAGGLARARFVEGPRSYRIVSWGAAASVVARFALASNVALVLAGGVDLFRTRIVFAVNSDASLTTPWLSPWVGAGLAWETAL